MKSVSLFEKCGQMYGRFRPNGKMQACLSLQTESAKSGGHEHPVDLFLYPCVGAAGVFDLAVPVSSGANAFRANGAGVSRFAKHQRIGGVFR
jgi:hypothetical protein